MGGAHSFWFKAGRRALLPPPNAPPYRGAMDFPHAHLLGIEPLAPPHITAILDLADIYAEKHKIE